MPNTTSAKKALKQSITKKSRNKHFSSLYKENIKSLERAIKSNSVEEANSLLSKVYSSIDKLVKKNIIHKNNGSRKKSKFAKFAKSLSLKS
ncbi:30S ribosomal protein S20 [Candidatus Gracilibacteria bacterium]|nr:30S ribosomal protein S20 [Candidatus Gracilibacteria bacterium]